MSVLGFSSFLDMGVGTTFRIVFHETDKSAHGSLYEEMQSKLMGITILFLSVVICCGIFIDIEYLILPLFLVIGIVPKSALAHLYVVEKSYTASSLLFLPSLIFACCAIVILLFMKLTISQLSLVLGLIYLAVYIFVYFYFGQDKYFTFILRNKQNLLAFSTNFSFVFIQLSAAFLIFIPGWFALNYLDTETSASFQIHWKLLTLLISLFSIINSRYLNLLSMRANNKLYEGAPKTAGIYFVALIFGLIMLIYPLVANEIVQLWMGPSFTGVNTFFFALSGLIFMFSGIASNKLSAEGKVKILLIVALFQVISLSTSIVFMNFDYIEFSRLYMIVILLGYFGLSSFTRLYEAKIV